MKNTFFTVEEIQLKNNIMINTEKLRKIILLKEKENEEIKEKENLIHKCVYDLQICPVCGNPLKYEIIKERSFLFFTNKRAFTYCTTNKTHYNEEDESGEEEDC